MHCQVTSTYEKFVIVGDEVKFYADGWELLRGSEAETSGVLDDFGVFVEKQQDGSFVHSTGSLFLELSTEQLYEDIVHLAD